MKKLLVLILCILLPVLAGCASDKKEQPVPKPPKTDTTHLTAEQRGITIKVSREIRNLSRMIKSSKEGHQVVSLQVAVENDSKDNVSISPDFVTLKTVDGTEYKYSPDLTETVTSKASFKKVTLPPDYRGGGLLIFEIKQGAKIESLQYKDGAGRDIPIKFSSEEKTNI